MVARPIFPIPVLVVVLLVPAAIVSVLVMRSGWPAKRKASSVARVSLVALLTLMIGLRPMVPNGRARGDALNVDCLFVVDTTLSMWADDAGGTNGSGTRIDGARRICIHMLGEMAGSSFAIVTFGSRGQVLAPFTQDIRTLEDALDVMMPPSQHSAEGSSMSAPIDKMGELLESASKRTDRKTVVVFISDGETTDESELASYADLAQYVDGGLVIGLGTTEGATMTVRDGWTATTVTDPETGGPAISRLDEDSLRQIAGDLGVRYVHAERTGDVDEMILALKDEAREALSDREEMTLYDDLYWIATIPLVSMLAWEMHSVVMRRRI